MLEKIIRELLTLRGINYTYEVKNKYELTRFMRKPNPDRQHLSNIRKWAKELDIPVSLIVRASKYNEMEEIWK